jgi:hypothetical protein
MTTVPHISSFLQRIVDPQMPHNEDHPVYQLRETLLFAMCEFYGEPHNIKRLARYLTKYDHQYDELIKHKQLSINDQTLLNNVHGARVAYHRVLLKERLIKETT